MEEPNQGENSTKRCQHRPFVLGDGDMGAVWQDERKVTMMRSY